MVATMEVEATDTMDMVARIQTTTGKSSTERIDLMNQRSQLLTSS